MARKRFLTETNKRKIHGFLKPYLLGVFSGEEIHRMIAEGFAFFPASGGTKASDIKNYIKMGFKVAFLRAGDFRELRKDYKGFI